MVEACELPINAIAARSGLITKRQPPPGTPETVAQLADRTQIVPNLAEVFHGTRASTLRHRDRDPFFVNEARLLGTRLCTGYPSYRYISDDGPPLVAGAAGSSPASDPEHCERDAFGTGARVFRAIFADWAAIDTAGEAGAGNAAPGVLFDSEQR
jgi:hypothetical protein